MIHVICPSYHLYASAMTVLCTHNRGCVQESWTAVVFFVPFYIEVSETKAIIILSSGWFPVKSTTVKLALCHSGAWGLPYYFVSHDLICMDKTKLVCFLYIKKSVGILAKENIFIVCVSWLFFSVRLINVKWLPAPMI